MDEGGSQVFVKLPGKVKNRLKTFREVTIDLMIDDFCSGSITNWRACGTGVGSHLFCSAKEFNLAEGFM
jgi:hypothetical protein